MAPDDVVVAAWYDWDPSVLVPAFYDILWSLVAVGIIAFAVIKWGVPRINGLLDERASKIEQGLRQAEEAEAKAAEVEAAADAELSEARREAAGVRERATAHGKELVEDARRRAADEGERLNQATQRQLAADKQQAAQALRSDVGNLAADLASRIVGESLHDQDLQERVIDRFLDDLETKGTEAVQRETASTSADQAGKSDQEA